MQLMVAATLVLLCSRPLEVAMLGQLPWLLTAPSIAIIGREVIYSISDLLLSLVINNEGGFWGWLTMEALGTRQALLL